MKQMKAEKDMLVEEMSLTKYRMKGVIAAMYSLIALQQHDTAQVDAVRMRFAVQPAVQPDSRQIHHVTN
jgi:hypothetical protein